MRVKLKIKLIHPSILDSSGKPIKFKRQFSPGLTLPYLAALFPKEFQIEIIEDAVEEINYDKPVDLVGITVMSAQAPRAYQIANEFRKRGVKVILGGFHPTFMPKEAEEHCDSVVIGEAEGLIETIVDDLKHGKLKPFYKRESPHDLASLPSPRYDLIKFKNHQAPFFPIQTNRGCPYNCSFCSVTRFYGARYRHRPIADVLEDVKNAGKFIFFADDNFTADTDYTLELLKELKKHQKYWFAQCSTSSLQKNGILGKMKDAGGTCLYIGFESLKSETLKKHRKGFNKPEDYRALVKEIHRNGLTFLASMMVGFDEDDLGTFDDILSFTESTKVHGLGLYILTPIPGTVFYEQCVAQNRLLTTDWSFYTGSHAVFRPSRMTAEELEKAYWAANLKFYSLTSMIKRLAFPPHPTWFIHNLMSKDKITEKFHPLQGEPLTSSLSFLPSLYGYLMNNDFVVTIGKKTSSLFNRLVS